MARINTGNPAKVFQIKKWLGLHESPDGDTNLKMGELSVMRNFKITDEGHLKIRAGTKTVKDLKPLWDAWEDAPDIEPKLEGMWFPDEISTYNNWFAAFGGALFYGDSIIGSYTAGNSVHFFSFGGKMYLIDGVDYKVYQDGVFIDVTGYIPTISREVPPAGGGNTFENVNRLNGYRKVLFSPDGTAKEFYLPEQGIDEVIAVEPDVSHTVNTQTGVITFSTAPTKGVDTIGVTYRKGDGAKTDVTAMRFSELYNGKTDSRVFLYGDGTNRAIYSGITSDGVPSAEYFPDLYELRAGDSSTPITSMVRHYEKLLTFKSDSTYTVEYTTLNAGELTMPAFYVTPVNRGIGNEAWGQAQLLENNPISIDTNSIYEWKSSNIITEERNAKRISEMIEATLSTFNQEEIKMYNDKFTHEFYFLYRDKALVFNYEANAWYYYTNFQASFIGYLNGVRYIGSPDGKIKEMNSGIRSDDGNPIDAYAETGSMDFEKDWMRKYSSIIYVGMKPESNARVYVTVQTNRRSDYIKKLLSFSLATFLHVDFNHFSFRTNRKPQVERVKLKIKKATFSKLVFESKSTTARATILSVDVNIRYTGMVK